jgi:hypothetical protein
MEHAGLDRWLRRRRASTRLNLWVVTILCLLLAIGCVPTVSAQGMVINEIQSANSKTIADEDGDHPDWIELYNAGTTAVDLAGYGISDDADTPFKWVFPTRTV